MLDSLSCSTSSTYAWPWPSSSRSVSKASFSSILLRANPTWIRTYSPIAGRSSPTRSPMFTFRRTPATSTLASSFDSSTISNTFPGMPRHISILLHELCEPRVAAHLAARQLHLLYDQLVARQLDELQLRPLHWAVHREELPVE